MGDTDERAASLDQQLDSAIRAVNRGDVTTARDLASQVLAADASSRDAATLLGLDGAGSGELRRLALLFCDLVGSTEMSGRHEPELYRSLVRRYTKVCRAVVGRYHGHVSHIAGDGLLAAFGLPAPHENDAERAVRAGLDILGELEALSRDVEETVGERLQARAAVHRGLVFVDLDDDEIYGLAANVAARLHGLAAPGTLLVSEDVLGLVGALFETEALPAQRVKGVDEPVHPYLVVAERPPAPARGRRWSAPLVGRGPELGRLRDAWKRVRDDPDAGPSLVHLVGEAGMGKSRLAAALAEEAGGPPGGSGTACVQLLGSPFHVDAAFSPVRARLEGDCGLAGVTDPGERLARLRDRLTDVGLDPVEAVPVLAPVLGIPPSAGYQAVEADSRKLHEAVTAGAARYLLAGLGAGPALLVVDDVHWCDGSTLDVVARVVGSSRRGLLVLTVSRDPAPAALGPAETIPLASLDDAAATELVRALDGHIDDAACRAVVARGDGVPLYLEELALTPAGDDHGGGRPGPAPSPPGGGTGGQAAPHAVPDALYDPLVSRLYATGVGAHVAAAAATIGRDVDPALLRQVAGMPGTELDEAVATLVRERVLVPLPGTGEHYRFRHELVRVVAYGLQPPTRRRRVHAQLAEALVAGADDDAVDWRVVAGHRAAAGLAAEAAAAYQQAADGTRRLGALSEARALLGRAIALVTELPDGPSRHVLEVGLRLRRGFLAASTEGNSSPDAVEDYERCLELGAGLGVGGDEALFTTLVPLFGYYMVRGDLDRAEQVAVELRSRLASGRQNYEPDNDAAFGMIRWYAGDFGAARERLEVSVAGLATRAGPPNYAATYFMPNDGPGSAHANLGIARFMGGDLRGADAEFDAARSRCASIEFPQGPFTAAFTESYATWTLVERGELAAAGDAAGALVGVADRHGFDLWELIGATEQATVAGLVALAERPDDHSGLLAHAETLEGLCDAWALIDLALFLPFFVTVAGRLRAAAGDPAGASARYEGALAVGATTGVHFYDAEVLRLRAGLTRGEGAAGQLRAALDLARGQGAAPFELRAARDLLALGEPDAPAALAAAVARFAADTHYADLDDARALLAR